MSLFSVVLEQECTFMCVMAVNSWTTILEVFSNLSNSIVFQMGFMYQDKDKVCKPNIFLHKFTSLESSVEVLLFCVLLSSCRRCSHSDK